VPEEKPEKLIGTVIVADEPEDTVTVALPVPITVPLSRADTAIVQLAAAKPVKVTLPLVLEEVWVCELCPEALAVTLTLSTIEAKSGRMVLVFFTPRAAVEASEDGNLTTSVPPLCVSCATLFAQPT
jgi:hypothetical protein